MARTEISPEHTLTMASEDYLEAIYVIDQDQKDSEGVRSVDIAEQLSVSKASVNKALTTLKENGMVEQSRYGRVLLTDEGREYGAHVWMCHRVLRAFLINDLGVDEDTANDEACLMEHALSYDTQRRWIDYMAKQGVMFER